MKATAILISALATLAAAAPVDEPLEERQCYTGPFIGGGCAVYATDNFPINTNCGDACIAEATRQGCCNPGGATWELVEADCAALYRRCDCYCA